MLRPSTSNRLCMQSNKWYFIVIYNTYRGEQISQKDSLPSTSVCIIYIQFISFLLSLTVILHARNMTVFPFYTSMSFSFKYEQVASLTETLVTQKTSSHPNLPMDWVILLNSTHQRNQHA